MGLSENSTWFVVVLKEAESYGPGLFHLELFFLKKFSAEAVLLHNAHRG
jgi:hypothetical protein